MGTTNRLVALVFRAWTATERATADGLSTMAEHIMALWRAMRTEELGTKAITFRLDLRSLSDWGSLVPRF